MDNKGAQHGEVQRCPGIPVQLPIITKNRALKAAPVLHKSLLILISCIDTDGKMQDSPGPGTTDERFICMRYRAVACEKQLIHERRGMQECRESRG